MKFLDYLSKASGGLIVLAIVLTLGGPLLGNVGPVEISILAFIWVLALVSVVALAVTKVNHWATRRKGRLTAP